MGDGLGREGADGRPTGRRGVGAREGPAEEHQGVGGIQRVQPRAEQVPGQRRGQGPPAEVITPDVLRQEGWHYELDDPAAPLSFKGVVFNEMKGAYSDPDNLLYRKVKQSLFPDNVYGNDSGGDPTEIPNLTYAQFKAFHDTYYHPSNALIYFYGDDDPEERLRRMAEYLAGYERRDVAADVALQGPFSEPRRVSIPYPVSADEADGNRAMVTVGWLLPEVTDRVLISGSRRPLPRLAWAIAVREVRDTAGLQLFSSSRLGDQRIANADMCTERQMGTEVAACGEWSGGMTGGEGGMVIVEPRATGRTPI